MGFGICMLGEKMEICENDSLCRRLLFF